MLGNVFGAIKILIYLLQVVIQYFEPSTTTCLLVPWLREVGFAILYGALVLKIYRFESLTNNTRRGRNPQIGGQTLAGHEALAGFPFVNPKLQSDG